MFNLIIAITKNGGIGLGNKLPWYCPQELKIFKEKTQNSILVVGSQTLKSLPLLPNRNIYCLTKQENPQIETPNPFEVINNLEKIPTHSSKVFIAGGKQVYEHALSRPDWVDTIHMSIMKDEYDCDTYFDLENLKDFIITEKQEFDKFTHYLLKKTQNGERQYLDLLNKIIYTGKEREGRNGITLSIFTEHLKFDLRNGFPLLTTKKMFLRGIIEEFLFFMRGDTDSTLLSNKKVKIWEGNTSQEFIKNKGLPYSQGVMGPMYGYQWRNFGAPYIIDTNGKPLKNSDTGIDQLRNVVNLIKNDPYSRRILMTSYNPSQAEEGVLYPCHSISIQFYVENQNLDMFCFNRSQDTFLGVPYNIASSSLLLMIVAKLTNKNPRFLNITMGDTHLYEQHIVQSIQQIERLPYQFPKITIPDIQTIEQIHDLTYEDFVLENYLSYSTIRAPMIV